LATCSIAASSLGTLPAEQVESNLAERSRPISELDDIDELVRVHRARILRLATYSTGDPDMAETIAQETLLRAYNGRDRFRGECSIRTWLTSIAIKVTRDHQRSKRFRFWRQVRNTAVDVHEVASFLPGDSISPERQMLAREKVEQLSAVLEMLSFNQRTVFLMKFSEEMAVDEIGETLGMSVNTVRTHLHRALQAVRSRMGVKK
jgi:RNA polymerase sigma-70 factor (ECF subfamily)